MPKPAYDHHWRRVRLLILARDGYQCRIRGPHCRGTATSVDHVVALCRGGARLDPSNLVAACVPCNSSKGNRDRDPVSEQW